MLKKIGVALFGNNRLKILEFPLNELKPNEILIEIKAAGICGSDLHFYRSTPTELGIRKGLVVGHEPSGIVKKTGSGATMFQIGDRVTVNHTLGCGKCMYCFQGETVLCAENRGIAIAGYGGDTNLLAIPETTCIPLIDNLSFIDGTFVACTGATAYNAAKRVISNDENNIAIFGLGPVGLSCILILQKMGAYVVGIDPNSKRREFAASLGVTNVSDFDTIINLKKQSPNLSGFNGSIETSGSIFAQSVAIDILAPKGRAVYLGLSKGKPSISPEQFIHKQITIIGSKVLPSCLALEMMEFLNNKKLSFERIVKYKFKLGDAHEAFDMFEKGTPGKFIFLPD